MMSWFPLKMLYNFIFYPLLITGVTFCSPYILGFIGLSSTGPIAGGIFATFQGASMLSGSWMAVAQSIAMTVLFLRTQKR
jgi:hypothetical protein